MILINLGGVGGCVITDAINSLIPGQEGQARYPYDWLVSNQTFVIESFLNIDKFFDFNDETQLRDHHFLIKSKNAFSAHDFKDYNKDKEIIKAKYERRFARLQDAMDSKEPILFIRILDHEPPHPEWHDIFITESESIPRWIEFVNNLASKFNKNIFLLILSQCEKEVEESIHLQSKNIFIKSVLQDKSTVTKQIKLTLDNLHF